MLFILSHKEMDSKIYIQEYDPIKIGSIDGTDTESHDHGIVRAMHAEYIPNKLVKGNPHLTVFIARLNPRTSVETVKTEFVKCGKVVHCRIVRDIVTGKSKQYAFVEYESSSGVDRALKELHNEVIDGSEIIVEREVERIMRGWKPRRLGGGFGGRKESGQLRFGCRDRPFRKPITVFKMIEKLTTLPPAAPVTSRALAKPIIPLTCTWVPSHKTEAVTIYYEEDTLKTSGTVAVPIARLSPLPASLLLEARRNTGGSEAEARGAASALVCSGRVRCAAVALSARWALASAKCVAAALGPGCELSRGGGQLLRVHMHGGAALLLVAGSLKRPATAPAPLLRHLTAIGERLTMITYAHNVSLEEASVLSDSVWLTESARCHNGRNVMCASTLRNTSCGFTAGGRGATAEGGEAGGALLRGRTVLAVTQSARRCGYVRFDDMLNDFAWIHEMLSSEITDD